MSNFNQLIGAGAPRAVNLGQAAKEQALQAKEQALQAAKEQALQCNAPPQPDGIINAIAGQLHARLQHLHSINARLESLADRLLGSMNTDGGGGSTCPQISGEVGNLGAAVPFADYLIEQLITQVKRLEQL